MSAQKRTQAAGGTEAALLFQRKNGPIGEGPALTPDLGSTPRACTPLAICILAKRLHSRLERLASFASLWGQVCLFQAAASLRLPICACGLAGLLTYCLPGVGREPVGSDFLLELNLPAPQDMWENGCTLGGWRRE